MDEGSSSDGVLLFGRVSVEASWLHIQILARSFMGLTLPLASVCFIYECMLMSMTAAKDVDYVFQGAGSEETHLSEDCSLWPLWPRLLPMGAAQKAQILNLLSFSPRLVGVYYREASKVPGVKCTFLFLFLFLS